MATPNLTDEEILFRRRARRRLIGAVVLVVAVVAIVPMILPENRPQQETQQIDIRIPAQDSTGYAPKIVAAPTPISAPPAPAAPDSMPAEPAKPAVDDAPKVDLAPPSHPTQALIKAMPDTAKPAPDLKQTYYVQYGAFSEAKNAKQKQAELKSKGITTFTEVVKTSGGDKVRVRSGPYSTRDTAEKVRERVKPLDSKLVVMGASG